MGPLYCEDGNGEWAEKEDFEATEARKALIDRFQVSAKE
jgi:hypothetical protein